MVNELVENGRVSIPAWADVEMPVDYRVESWSLKEIRAANSMYNTSKPANKLVLMRTKKNDIRLLIRMQNHYSKPKGFVGRNICYAILCDGDYYGHIVGGSATKFLPNRNEYFDIARNELNNIVNNTFFNINKVGGKYPVRNFTTKVIKLFMEQVAKDWQKKYGDVVVGYETLVEKPMTGNIYVRAGWEVISETIGYTCKRIAGVSTDSWSGRRVWNTDRSQLRPKLVICYKRNVQNQMHKIGAAHTIKSCANFGFC